MSKNRKQKSSIRASSSLNKEVKDKNLPSVPATGKPTGQLSRSYGGLNLAAETQNGAISDSERTLDSPMSRTLTDPPTPPPTRLPPELPLAKSDVSDAVEAATADLIKPSVSLPFILAEPIVDHLQKSPKPPAKDILDQPNAVDQKDLDNVSSTTENGDVLPVENSAPFIEDAPSTGDTSTPAGLAPLGPAIDAPEVVSSSTKPTSTKETVPLTPNKIPASAPAVPPRSVDRAHGRSTSVTQLKDVPAVPTEVDTSDVPTPKREQSIVSAADVPSSIPAKIDESTSAQNISGSSSLDELPTTPRISHKRDFSTVTTPSRYKHSISKSLETSPNLAYLGASVTTFEGDLSSAFNLSPRNSVTPAPQAGASLERSNTISRLASRMLKHRKSVSGSALSPKGSPKASNTNPEVAVEVSALQQELKFKNDRVAQLEVSLRQVGEARNLERQLESRKSRLANLESQILQTEAETASYLHHRHRISDVTVPFNEWKANVVADVDASLKDAKDKLSSDIEELIKHRNELIIDNERLELQKTTLIQELIVLDQRHSSLVEMNDNMLKHIQTSMVANKDQKDMPALPSPKVDPTVISRTTNRSPGRNTVATHSTQLSDSDTRFTPETALEGDSFDSFAGYAIAHDRDIEEEDEPPSTAQTRNEDHTAASKKFNFTKKAKKAFRWGRTNSSQDVSLASYPSNGSSYDMPPSTSYGSITTSKSNDKLSTKTSGTGMFKRTWQSQNNLSGHLQDRSADSASSGHDKLFGNDLCLQAESESRQVPQIVTSCIAVIEARALQFEGLYRKSGGAGEMKNLIEAFEAANFAHEAVDFANFKDISAITSVLKQYLRRLPVPLITFNSYEPFISTSAFPDPEVRLRAVRDILRNLPGPHYQTLRTLFNHFQLVSQHSDKNLMTAKNLAVVLGPTVIWDQSGSKEITDMHDKNQSIQFLIENAARL